MLVRAGIDPGRVRPTALASACKLLCTEVTHTDKTDASTFADWVFHQTFPNASKRPEVREKDLDRGRFGHETILTSICKSHDFKVKFKRKTSAVDWRPTYVDSKASSHTYLASSLRVDGRPMRCRPDLVFAHRSVNAVVIVEYKMTSFGTAARTKKDHARTFFDPEGHPNDRAQLWCYSHIDDFRDANELFLVLQIWDAITFENKATLAWLRADEALEKEARGYFLKYGGEIQAP